MDQCVPSIPRRGMRRDAKLPAVAIRTFRRFRSHRTRSGLEVLASSNLQEPASDRLVYRRRNKTATRVISIKLLFPHSRMTTTCRAYSSREFAQFRRYSVYDRVDFPRIENHTGKLSLKQSVRLNIFALSFYLRNNVNIIFFISKENCYLL